jgi:hypothetical protein
MAVAELALGVAEWAKNAMVGDETEKALGDNLLALVAKLLPHEFTGGLLVQELTKTTGDTAQSWKLLAMFSEVFLAKQGRKTGVKEWGGMIDKLCKAFTAMEAAKLVKPHNGGKGASSLREFGVRNREFPEYNGEPGKCSMWVRRARQFIRDQKVPPEHHAGLFRSALKGPVWNEFSRLMDESKDDLDISLDRLKAMRDIGRRDELIKQQQCMMQNAGESAVDFHVRFIEVQEELKAYSPVTETDLFISKLRHGNRVRASNPASMEEAVKFAALVGSDEPAVSKGSEYEERVAVAFAKRGGKPWGGEQAVCHLFRDSNPQVCRYGDKCKFKHIKN